MKKLIVMSAALALAGCSFEEFKANALIQSELTPQEQCIETSVKDLVVRLHQQSMLNDSGFFIQVVQDRIDNSAWGTSAIVLEDYNETTKAVTCSMTITEFPGDGGNVEWRVYYDLQPALGTEDQYVTVYYE